MPVALASGSRRVSLNSVKHPRVDAALYAHCLEAMSPSMVWLNVGNAQCSDPSGNFVANYACWGVAAVSVNLAVEQWSRAARLHEISETKFYKVRVNWNVAILAIFNRSG